jgi:hypothetical protein
MNTRPDERLEAALLAYLESVERGADPDLRALSGGEPALAAEVLAFAEIYCQVGRLTAPVRAVARVLAAPIRDKGTAARG